MKLQIEKSLLEEGLQAASKAINSKSSYPILHGILFEVTQEGIYLTGSDSSETIRAEYPIDEQVIVEQEGSTVVPKNFLEIIKKAKGLIKISVDKHVMEIEFGNGKTNFELNCMDADEYHNLPKLENNTPTLLIGTETFMDAIRKTAHCVSDSETRPILQGVCISRNGTDLQMVATDSHRLGSVSISTDSEGDFSCVVPGAFLLKISKLCTGEETSIFINENMILIKNGNYSYYSRLYEGNYPDTSKLIPTSYQTTVTLNRKEVIDTIELIQEVSVGDRKTTLVTMEIENSNLVKFVSKASAKGKGVSELFCQVDGENSSLTYNGKYVVDALKTMTCEDIKFCLTGAVRPFTLLNALEDNCLQLVLPVRTY